MATAKALAKTPANVAGADTSSGMQRASNTGIIGVVSTTDGQNTPGQSIGLPASSTFHVSAPA